MTRDDYLDQQVAEAFASDVDLANALSEYMPERSIEELADVAIAIANGSFNPQKFIADLRDQLRAEMDWRLSAHIERERVTREEYERGD